MKKLLAILLTFFSLYTALDCYQCFYGFGSSFFRPSNSTNPQTTFASWLILITHFFQMCSFFTLSYYGASAILNINREYASNTWLYIGVFTSLLYILEYIAWAMPLRLVEGFESTNSFISRFINSIVYQSKHNLFQFLAYASFFGLFAQFKSKVVK